jgi:hypothetical protein
MDDVVAVSAALPALHRIVGRLAADAEAGGEELVSDECEVSGSDGSREDR